MLFLNKLRRSNSKTQKVIVIINAPKRQILFIFKLFGPLERKIKQDRANILHLCKQQVVFFVLIP